MSSFSPSRPSRPAAVLTALLVAAGGLPLGAADGATPGLDIVAVDASADPEVSLVADVRPAAATPIRSEDFSVAAGDVRLRTRAVPVLSDRPALGVVVDASAAGGSALQEGASGAANLLLQLPYASDTAVVADTSPPTVLAPARTGVTDAVRALSAVRAGGDRATSQALTLVLRQLPAVPGGRRVVVLYTSGRDAGGVSAADLVRGLAGAQALLAVVSRGSDTQYWSRVASATGGVLVAASPSAVITAFDDVAAALRARYVLNFQVPEGLPAEVSVRVSTADGTLTTQTLVSPGQNGSAADEGGGSAALLWLLVLGAAALLVILATVRLVVSRRTRSPEGPGIKVTYQRLESVLGASPVPRAPTETEKTGIDATDTEAEPVTYGAGDTPPAVVAATPSSPGGGRAEPDVTSGDEDAQTDVPAGPEIPPSATAAPATPPAPTSGSGATSVAAAVAAAQQRARDVAAASRSAAAAARGRSQPSRERPSEDAPESDRSDEDPPVT